MLYQVGEDSDRFYFLGKGTIELLDAHNRQLRTLHPGMCAPVGVLVVCLTLLRCECAGGGIPWVHRSYSTAQVLRHSTRRREMYASALGPALSSPVFCVGVVSAMLAKDFYAVLQRHSHVCILLSFLAYSPPR